MSEATIPITVEIPKQTSSLLTGTYLDHSSVKREKMVSIWSSEPTVLQNDQSMPKIKDSSAKIFTPGRHIPWSYVM